MYETNDIISKLLLSEDIIALLGCIIAPIISAIFSILMTELIVIIAKLLLLGSRNSPIRMYNRTNHNRYIFYFRFIDQVVYNTVGVYVGILGLYYSWVFNHRFWWLKPNLFFIYIYSKAHSVKFVKNFFKKVLLGRNTFSRFCQLTFFKKSFAVQNHIQWVLSTTFSKKLSTSYLQVINIAGIK